LFGIAEPGAEIKNLGLTDLSISGRNYIGGLIGFNYSLVSNCYSASDVIGHLDVGGLIGNNDGTVSNSYSTGSVRGDKNTGGLIASNLGTVTNSYSTGNVTRKTSSHHTSFGGFCGNSAGKIENSYATGSVFVEDGDALTNNGFAGTIKNTAIFNNNFWDSESSNQTGAIGAESKTTLEMKQFKTFDDAGWNIKEITNSSYTGSPYPGLVTSGTNIWQINASYKITYNANDAQTGTVPDQQIKFYGQDLVLASNTGSLAKAGYFFAGWNTQPDASGTDYDSGGVCTSNKNLGLYAKWTKENPVVTTLEVTNISKTSATGNGNIISLGKQKPTAHGICWSKSSNPTTSDSCTDSGSVSSTGAFTASIAGLNQGTDYHVRAFAANLYGTSYGQDIIFTTLKNPPLPKYTIKFVIDPAKGTHSGGGSLTQTIEEGSGAAAPAVSSISGYIFNGWDISFSNVHSDLIVNAQFDDPLPEADLCAGLSVDSARPKINDFVTFTITVSNNGPDPAMEVSVAQCLSPGLSYVSHKGSGTYFPLSGQWSIKELASGEHAKLHIVSKVESAEKIINTAAVSSVSPMDPKTSNNTASVELNGLQSGADMGIFAAVSPSAAGRDETIVIALTVFNQGPKLASDVNVFAELDKGFENVCYKTKSMTEFETWTGVANLGLFSPGVTKTVWIKATTGNIPEKEKLAVSASVSAAETDGNMGNNTASVYINSNPLNKTGDLSLAMGAVQSGFEKGSSAELILVLANNGPDTAEKICVKNLLPSGLDYAGHSGDGSYNPATGIWKIETLENAMSAALRINIVVNTELAFIHSAYISELSIKDPVKSNNCASAVINSGLLAIDPALDTSIKGLNGADISKLKTGDRISFNVTLTRIGTNTEAGLQVQIAVLPGMIVKGFNSSSGCYDFLTSIWHVNNASACSETRTPMAQYNGSETSELHTLELELEIEDETRITDAVLKAAIVKTLDGSGNDPDITNNTSSVILNPTTPFNTDLAVQIHSGTKNIKSEENIIYTVLVRNNGPDPASAVQIGIDLDPAFAYKTFYCDMGLFSADKGIWTIGSLAPGESCTMLIEAVCSDFEGNTRTSAWVARISEKDINEDNSSDSADIKAGTLYTVKFVPGENGNLKGLPVQSVTSLCICSEVAAVPDEGYVFTGWTGDYTGTENPLALTNVSKDMTINAVFESAVTADFDKDGIADVIEKGPSGTTEEFDGNSDGISDWKQAQTVSLHTGSSGGYATVSTGAGRFSNIEVISPVQEDLVPSGYLMSHGIFNLNLENIGENCSAEIYFNLHGETKAPEKVFVYNPNGSELWKDLSFNPVSDSVFSVSFQDGEEDMDSLVNGKIILRLAPAWKDNNSDSGSSGDSLGCFINSLVKDFF
jgi:uncharacterized repeat protein (TIGR01451 family)/uncharacterized repeat protein (TIGR02543 family)